MSSIINKTYGSEKQKVKKKIITAIFIFIFLVVVIIFLASLNNIPEETANTMVQENPRVVQQPTSQQNDNLGSNTSNTADAVLARSESMIGIFIPVVVVITILVAIVPFFRIFTNDGL